MPALTVVGAGFTMLPTLGAPDTEGDGGGIMQWQTSLYLSGVGFTILPSTVTASMVTSFPDPVLFPRRVRAVVSLFDVSASDFLIDWGDGSTTPNDLDDTHEFVEGGTYVITFTARNELLDLNIEETATVILPQGLPTPEAANATPTLLADYTQLPRETKDDVLNITLGRHGYEHLFAMHFPVDRNVIRRRQLSNVAPSTAETVLISFVPDRDVVIRSADVDTDGDGTFTLRVGGATEGAARVTRSRGHGSLVRKDSYIPVPRGIRIEVAVRNTGLHLASYRATVFAEQGPVGVL